MGESRDLLNRVTEAFFSGDWTAAESCYAPDAIAVTPDQGELKGGHEIAAYLKEMFKAFPDARYEPAYTHECGSVAVDEGWFVGTNTGPIEAPDGTQIPATGKRVRVRGCDVATVENGAIVSHRMYWDQGDFIEQLGLTP